MAIRLERDSEVLRLAHELGMKGRWANPVQYLADYCRRVVDGWVEDFQPSTLDELLDTVLCKLGVIIHEVESDADLHQLCDRYAATGELVFERVRRELDAMTFALVLRLRNPARGCTHVAVIDCRGSKANRRWFSKWHEVAHLLTTPQLELSFRTCGGMEADALEQLMDRIAGMLAFYEPLYQIGIEAPYDLTLPALENVRRAQASESSRETAFTNAIERVNFPAWLIVADRDLKISERRKLEKSGGDVALARVHAPLRAIRVAYNAVGGMLIPRNMRVPEESVIHETFHGESPDLAVRTRTAIEDLALWTSQGRSLEPRRLRVEAGRSGQRVFALITECAA